LASVNYLIQHEFFLLFRFSLLYGLFALPDFISGDAGDQIWQHHPVISGWLGSASNFCFFLSTFASFLNPFITRLAAALAFLKPINNIDRGIVLKKLHQTHRGTSFFLFFLVFLFVLFLLLVFFAFFTRLFGKSFLNGRQHPLVIASLTSPLLLGRPPLKTGFGLTIKKNYQ
jgi:hypothetical protein